MQVGVICATLFVLPLVAAERMTVSVCAEGHLNEKTVVGAEAAATQLFHAVDIDVSWASCESGLEGEAAVQNHWYTARFRDGRALLTPGPAALDPLGEAFFSDSGGYLADVYYEGIQTLASTHEVEFTTLLGYVMAHEICHLLVGPGHAASGVMRRAWDRNDLIAMREGRLKFAPADGARMRRALQGTATYRAEAP